VRYYILGAIALITIVVVAALIAFVTSLSNMSIGRRHLDPIPVAASACPYLRPVHDSAESAGRTYLRLLSGRTDPNAWGAEAAQHGQQLAALELTLLAAIPHVPKRVAAELEQVSANVAAGRTAVAVAPSASDYVSRSSKRAFDGIFALEDASDLVGNACGFELSPNVTELDGVWDAS
jgi:hypothetical protein